ncbi:hypothetical protein AB1Y20_016317 [Prymnesium parvum]|uniref:Magnesium transporter n=1 Tax=Prymnesium parvum TaxID=97485 RepID=A0AB34ICI4_PRYPA
MPPSSPSTSGALWQVGVSLIVCGCLSSSIGLLFMKRSTEVEVGVPLYRRWRWMLGFLFLVVNATIIDLIAYGITPLSLIAPFAGLTMVFSLLLARSGWCYVHESMSETQLVGATLVLVGVTTVSTFGPHSSDEPTMEDIFDDFNDPSFISFAVLTLSMVAGYLLLLFWPRLAAYRLHPSSRIRTILSAYSAAVCGAESQLFLKVVSVGMREVFTGNAPAAAQPAFFISLIGLALTAPLQLYLLNATLSSSPVSYAVPLYQALLIMLTTAAGGIFFHEFAHIPVGNAVAFALGSAVAMAGLFVLSLKVPQLRENSPSSSPSEEFVVFSDKLPLRKPGLDSSVSETIGIQV